MVIFEASEDEAVMQVKPDTMPEPLIAFEGSELAELVEDESMECLDSFVSIKREHAESDEEEITYSKEDAYLRRRGTYMQKCSYDELQKTPEQEDEEERRLFAW